MSMLNTEADVLAVESKTVARDLTTRLDPPHRTAADQDFKQSVHQAIYDEAELRGDRCGTLDTLTENSVHVAEQLRAHANQLATHLQQQQQDLDDRESRLHAQMAEQQNEQRNARLHLTEKAKKLERLERQLEQREESLGTLAREVEEKTRIAESLANAAEEKASSAEHQARAAEEKASSAEHQARAAEEKARSAEHEARAAEIRTLEAESQARTAEAAANVAEIRTHEAEKRVQSSEQWVQLSQAMKAPSDPQDSTTEEVATPTEPGNKNEQHPEATEITVGENEPRAVRDIRAQVGEHQVEFPRQRYRMLSAELIKKKEILERRSEALDQRGAEADQLRRKVMSLHKETLETRLVTEELWIRVSGRMSTAAMTRSLAELKTKLSEHYRLAGEHLTRKEHELETLSAKLNDGFRSLEQRRKDLQEQFIATADETASTTPSTV